MASQDEFGKASAGIGGPDYRLAIHIGNRPPLPRFQTSNQLQSLASGELAEIVAETGNHWRKIFNLYAKLAFAMNPRGTECWQQYRDQRLLQAGSEQALLFGALEMSRADTLFLIAGKGHAERLCAPAGLVPEPVDADFSILRSRQLIVTPYLDYRQLSNAKLLRLLELIAENFPEFSP